MLTIALKRSEVCMWNSFKVQIKLCTLRKINLHISSPSIHQPAALLLLRSFAAGWSLNYLQFILPIFATLLCILTWMLFTCLQALKARIAPVSSNCFFLTFCPRCAVPVPRRSWCRWGKYFSVVAAARQIVMT